MLKIEYHCSYCGASGVIFDPTDENELVGCCPSCHSHHGEVEYMCTMKVRDFLVELSSMNEATLAKSHMAIQICADSLAQDL